MSLRAECRSIKALAAACVGGKDWDLFRSMKALAAACVGGERFVLVSEHEGARGGLLWGGQVWVCFEPRAAIQQV